MIRGSIVSMIYKQTLDWKSNDSTESAAMTLMSTDIERIMAGAEDLHEIWANIVQISVATWLLEQKLLWACIVPIIFSIGKPAPIDLCLDGSRFSSLHPGNGDYGSQNRCQSTSVGQGRSIAARDHC